MRVIINGLGCPYTGAKYILNQIVKSAPKHIELTVIVPIVNDEHEFTFPGNVKIIKLKHRIWGMYLRIFLELYVNFLMLLRRYDLLVNLSNYGLCFTPKQVLYIHNPLILDMNASKKFGQGNPNRLIRMALNLFLKNAESVYVQTQHMRRQLIEYCSINQMQPPKKLILLQPLLSFQKDSPLVEVSKKFEFEFFYPASHFPHKRTDLAINGIVKAHAFNDRIGLQITTFEIDLSPGVNHLGLICEDEVYAQFKICDALLFTSERETLGLPLLEALEFEKPAVLPNREYAREIYGEAGLYYDEDTSESISRAIISLYNNYDKYLSLVKIQKKKEFQKRISWPQHWEEFLINA